MKLKENTYNLYADIILVKGYTRSILLDITKKNYWYITNELFEILNGKINFGNLEKKYPDDIKTLNQYKKFLLKNDLIFPISHNEMDTFPRISLKWHTPSEITNMIIDIDNKTSVHTLSKINNEVGKLGVEAILFRCFSIKKLQELKKSIFHLADSESNKLRDIQLEIAISKEEHLENLVRVLKEILALSIISLITLYTKDENLINALINESKIYIVQKTVINHKSCGNVMGNIDSINIEIISEAVNHNSCLNCKLSIDALGNIKNCPSMPQSFGNIKDTTLEKALHHQDFKNYWNLTKDEIEVCKYCEFRYICTDCRAYTELTHTSKEGLDISKPLKCGYNPYTGEWEEWNTNPLKQKAIQHYELENSI